MDLNEDKIMDLNESKSDDVRRLQIAISIITRWLEELENPSVESLISRHKTIALLSKPLPLPPNFEETEETRQLKQELIKLIDDYLSKSQRMQGLIAWL